jgi:hypothetical protein
MVARPESAKGGLPSQAPFGLRLLYWRKNFFDPDPLFIWLAPRSWFFWTPAFLVVSACCIILAAGLVWANGQAVAGSFLSALRWETALFAWLTLLFVTTCHEFAHGLASWPQTERGWSCRRTRCRPRRYLPNCPRLYSL